MHSLIQKTYDRADVLMSAGCSTFISAALILVIPRFGVAIIEILVGLFLICCAFTARARLSLKDRARSAKNVKDTAVRWFDRYDAGMFLAVMVVQAGISGSLRRLGWSEGSVRIFPLILVGAGILMKPRLMRAIARRAQSNRSDRGGDAEPPPIATTVIASPDAWRPAGDTNHDFEQKGVR